MTLSKLLPSPSLNFHIIKMGIIIICKVKLIAALGFPRGCRKDNMQPKYRKTTRDGKSLIVRSVFLGCGGEGDHGRTQCGCVHSNAHQQLLRRLAVPTPPGDSAPTGFSPAWALGLSFKPPGAHALDPGKMKPQKALPGLPAFPHRLALLFLYFLTPLTSMSFPGPLNLAHTWTARRGSP